MDSKKVGFWDTMRIAPQPVTEETEAEKQKKEAESKAYKKEEVERITAIFVENKDNLTVAISLFCKEENLDFEDIHSFAIDNIRNPEIIINEVISRVDLIFVTSEETERLENKEKRLSYYSTNLKTLSIDLGLVFRFIGIFSSYNLVDVYDSFKTEVQPTTLGRLLNLEGSSNGQSNFLKYLQIAIEKLARESEKHFNQCPDLKDKDEKATRSNLFKFLRVETHLDSLSNEESQLNYLKKIRDDFTSEFEKAGKRKYPLRYLRGVVYLEGKLTFSFSEDFLKDVNSKIDLIQSTEQNRLLKGVISYTQSTQSKVSIEDEESLGKATKNAVKANQDQIILAFDYLFGKDLQDKTISQKSNLLSLLSQFSSEKIRQKISTIREKASEKDYDFVIKFLSNNGFTEAAERIENDYQRILQKRTK